MDPIDIIGDAFDGIDWNILGVWFGAFGTLVAAVGTVGALIWTVQSANAARAETLQLRLESAEREKRAQAVLVSAWIHGNWAPRAGGGNTTFRVRNGSQEPVYEAVLHLVWFQGAGFHTGQEAEKFLEAHNIRAIIQVLPPGEFYVTIPGPSSQPMQGRPAVEMAFTDAANHHWVRNRFGALSPVNERAFKYYDLSFPLPPFNQLRSSPLDE
ncbi:hypothetical protein [Mycobacterium marseillense]|uniref:Uncharacterized protein n=1 Tax=Mycobacterium marseillense TaxID=701042 RepID=A0AAC9YLS8_9MYCO|nr:hypothetical protein [Mycobacterium marseillense]ASW91269.1 hypothetical protein CKJ54_16355 [Mycobacterium marseillense]